MSAFSDQTSNDLNNINNFASGIPAASSTLLGGQQSAIDAANAKNSAFFNDPNNNLTAIASNISNQLGLPTLQANASRLNTQVANMPFTYRDASRGFDVNNNQLDRIVNQKTTDLTPAMTSANNALAAGQNQFGLLTSQAQQDIANRATPLQMAQASMLDQLARQATMFTTANQQELDGLVAKMQSGVQLTTTEMNNATSLAVAEKQYQGYLAQANAQQNVAKIYSSNQVLGPGSTYYNPSSGQAYNPFVNVPSR